MHNRKDVGYNLQEELDHSRDPGVARKEGIA